MKLSHACGRWITACFGIALILGGFELPAVAEGTSQAATAAIPAPIYRVAVFPFDAASLDISRDVLSLLQGYLSTDTQLELVDRDHVSRSYDEVALSNSGLVPEELAIRAGRMAGAEFMISGRVYVVDQELFITATVTNTSTTRMKVFTGRTALNSKLDSAIMTLSQKITVWFANDAFKLMPPPDEREASIDWLRNMAAGRRLPRVAVVMNERHMQREIQDQSAYTELVYMLIKVGFPVYEGGSQRERSDWARSFARADASYPHLPDNVEIIMLGDAVSEAAIRRGELISVIARGELRAINRSTREILAIARTTREVRETDVSEMAASKRSRSRASARVSVELIADLLNRLEAR